MVNSKFLIHFACSECKVDMVGAEEDERGYVVIGSCERVIHLVDVEDERGYVVIGSCERVIHLVDVEDERLLVTA